MRHRLLLSSALLVAPSLAACAQTTRWNDRAMDRFTEEAPIVSVWFEDSRQLRFGSSPRVRFRVEDDAYVVVGRVDSDGRMTILFPYNRSSTTRVRGNSDHLVRSRRGGTNYSFTAYERWGMGFVFAIASNEPMDLSKLRNRDFESTGIVSAITERYTGNPTRIVERFAPWVLYDRDTPYDFDIANYAVEGSAYTTVASFCGSYSGFDGFYDPSFCHRSYGYYGFFCSTYLGFGSALCYDPYFGRFYNRNGIIVSGPQTPPTQPTAPESTPNTKLIPQIPAPGDDGKITGGQKARVAAGQPDVGGTASDEELNRVYSIPRRALDDLRRQEMIERRPLSETAGGLRLGDAGPRPTPGSRGEGRQPGGDRRQPRDDPLGRSGRENWVRGQDNPTTRGDTRQQFDPPPRESPRTFDAPPRGGDNGGSRIGRGSERSFDPPPRSFEPPSRAGGRSDAGGGGGRIPGDRTMGGGIPGSGAHPAPSTPTPRTQAPAVREPAVEKKPEKP
ncbi:MAG: hypothetical protein MNPFHGCM_00600 [Gemmatimonadaceae bacterium]|nr:hypothetical protein [Gemmatimonadaceae bacterium]